MPGVPTRYVMLVKLTGKDTETVVNALIKNARKLPQELYKSLTRAASSGCFLASTVNGW